MKKKLTTANKPNRGSRPGDSVIETKNQEKIRSMFDLTCLSHPVEWFYNNSKIESYEYNDIV